ncbi:hypothetical protein CEXT_329101 [Caerostris extrusa]|uniref:Uncharacterized protein n=1 Tax=Caerostris extrusa TaxID=172846 RepID=A0AAV4NVM4_CAEEX|nr:hypothetical protein CEXT_329101 [Caerostris extrusa]
MVTPKKRGIWRNRKFLFSGKTGALLRRHSIDPDRRRTSGNQAAGKSPDDHHTALIHRGITLLIHPIEDSVDQICYSYSLNPDYVHI